MRPFLGNAPDVDRESIDDASEGEYSANRSDQGSEETIPETSPATPIFTDRDPAVRCVVIEEVQVSL
jgi:hypothetical protein